MEPVENLLKLIMQDEETHACWLNSLSYLEYRGWRKIARALRTEDMDEEVLTHAMEEARHALYFKHLAIKCGGPDFRFYRPETMLAETAIKRYFYELDRQVEAALANAQQETRKSVYRLVTWLIEERALTVYRHYENLLKESGHSVTLKPILADEDRHLHQVKNQLSATPEIDTQFIFQLEKNLFAETWLALQMAATESLSETA